MLWPGYGDHWPGYCDHWPGYLQLWLLTRISSAVNTDQDIYSCEHWPGYLVLWPLTRMKYQVEFNHWRGWNISLWVQRFMSQVIAIIASKLYYTMRLFWCGTRYDLQSSKVEHQSTSMWDIQDLTLRFMMTLNCKAAGCFCTLCSLLQYFVM